MLRYEAATGVEGANVATRIETFFTADDRRAIEDAVRAAEQRSAGEIVPFAVARCDHYEAAAWKGSLVGSLVAAAAAAAARYLGGYWGVPSLLWIALPPLLGGALGYIAALARPLRLALAGHAEVEHQVQQRAAVAFLHNELFKTRERTGILIFLALYERRVVVLGDAGINAHVQPHEWDAIVAATVAGIRAGTPGKALASAIDRCGELLQRRGVTLRADDRDELPDTLQMREE